MVWFKVDDNLSGHAKPRRAGLGAMGLWVMAGSYCGQQLTDGFVPDWYVNTWPSGRKLAAALVNAGLWSVSGRDGEQGWQFHEWAQANPTRAQVEADRASARERQKKHRSGSQTDRHGVTDGVTNAVPSPSVTVPRPDPTRRHR